MVKHFNPKISENQLLKKAMQFIPFIERYDTEIMEEIRGIATGAERSLDEIMFLNARAELSYPQMRFSGSEFLAECSTLSITPEASRSGHTLIMENWDPWVPIIRHKPFVVLKIEQEDKPDIICYTEAGIIGGKIGFNSEGIGLGVNGLFTDEDGKTLGVPWSTICRGVMNGSSWYYAINAVLRAKRSISLNFNICTAEGEAICVEAAPSYDYCFTYSESGVLPHTNHFVCGSIDSSSAPEYRARNLPNTVPRYLRLRKLALQMRGDLDIDNIKDICRDHFNYPHSICRHPPLGIHESEAGVTAVSLISDLDAEVMYIACGPPCEYEYERVPLKLS